MRTLPFNYPAGGNAGFSGLFAFGRHWPGVPHPGCYASAMLRIILLTVLLMASESVYAHHVTYSAYRRFVEERCATNTTPQDERVFVMATGAPMIVRFHQGITLREIIDQTTFKGKTAWICVLRTDHPVLDHFTRIGRKEKPKDQVKRLDLILLKQDAVIIET